MKIFVDADSCPREIRPVVMKRGEKEGIPIIFVANRKIDSISGTVEFIQVSEKPEAADRYIEMAAGKGDLIVTRDILLAQRLVEKGIDVINDRGDKFERETIGERVSKRNYMEQMRLAGAAPAMGRRRYGEKEKKLFSDAFDRQISFLKKS